MWGGQQSLGGQVVDEFMLTYQCAIMAAKLSSKSNCISDCTEICSLYCIVV